MNKDIKSSGIFFSAEYLARLATVLWCISAGWSTALSNIMMAVSSLLVLFVIFQSKKSIQISSVILHPASILFLLMAISIFWSQNISDGFSNLKSYIPFILFPIVIQFWMEKDSSVLTDGVKYLGYSLCIGFLITIVWNLLPEYQGKLLSEQLSRIVKPYTDSNRSLFGWYVPFMERIHFSNLLSYSGLAFFFIFLKEKKYHYLILSVLLLSSPFILGARASMIAVISIIPVILIYSLKGFSLKIKPLIFLIGIIIVSVTGYISYPTIEARYRQTMYELDSIQDQSYHEKSYVHFTTLTRFIAWKHAWNLYTEKPLTGHGIGNYLELYETEYTQANSDLPVCYHSQWLYFLGVFGSIGLLIFTAFYIRYWILLKDPVSVIYFWCFTSYISIIWLFDTGLLQKKEMMAFVLFLSFSACLKKSDISYT